MEYLKFIEKLVNEKKASGPDQSAAMLQYTELSLQRLKRWNKTAVLLPEVIEKIQSLNSLQNWVILTESWCGDAAHAFVFIEKMAALNPLISFEWKLRDENLELMDQYLTNGGRSIPKLIATDESGDKLFDWGPRPKHIQNKFLALKNEGVPYEEASIVLQKMYNADKGVSTQKEILNLM